jgi:negative regulator of sigma E activity
MLDTLLVIVLNLSSLTMGEEEGLLEAVEVVEVEVGQELMQQLQKKTLIPLWRMKLQQS